VPGCATTRLDANDPEGEVELVVNDDDLLGRDAIEASQPAHLTARLIHERGRSRQYYRCRAEPRLCNETAALVALELRSRARGQLAQHHGPGVVAGRGIALAGVAEPGDDKPVAVGAHPPQR